MMPGFSLIRSAMFVLLALAAIFVQLLPLGLVAGAGAAPDLLLVMACAWAVRRPEHMPLLLVAAMLLLADMIQDRPVGLWAMIGLLMVEAMRAQRDAYRGRPFVVEWAGFALALALGLIAQGLVLKLALVGRPEGIDLPLKIFAVTAASYPAVALLLHYGLRIRAPRPAERSSRLGRVA